MLTQDSQNTNTESENKKDSLNTLHNIEVVESEIKSNSVASDTEVDNYFKLIFDLRTHGEYSQWCLENWLVINTEKIELVRVPKKEFEKSNWSLETATETNSEIVKKSFRKNVPVKGSWVFAGGMTENQWGESYIAPGYQDHQLDPTNAYKKFKAWLEYEKRKSGYYDNDWNDFDNLENIDWNGFKNTTIYHMDTGLGNVISELSKDGSMCYINPNTLNYGTEARNLFNFDEKDVYAFFFEHDDEERSWKEKLTTFIELGFPTPSLVLFTGNKSVHFIYTFDREDRPTPTQARELAAQINRQGGFDGFEQHSPNPLKNFRIPGQKHAKSNKKSQVMEWGRPYTYTELKEFFFAPERELGRIKDEAKKRIGSVANYADVLSPEWRDNFYAPGEWEAEQEVKRVEAEKRKAEAKAKLEKVEKALYGKDYKETKVNNLKVTNGQIDLRQIQSKERQAELLEGTVDGHGRWKSAVYFANTLVELEYIAKTRGLEPTESAEDIFISYIHNTFCARTESEKVESFLNLLEEKLKNPAPEDGNTYTIWKEQAVQRWIDRRYQEVILKDFDRFLHGADVIRLIQGVKGEDTHLVDNLDLSKCPILFDSGKITWEGVIESAKETRSIHASKDLATSLEIINEGGFVAFIGDNCSDELLHKTNGLMVKANLAYIVTNDEKFLATKLRSGYASTNYDKQHKPAVLTLDDNGNRWGYNYYQSFIENDIAKSLETGKLTGIVGDIERVSELVEAHHSKIKSAALIAIKSGTGTGKTYAAANIIGATKLKICLTHSEQLAKQDAARFGVKSYKKAPVIKDLSAEEKQEIKDNRHTRYEEAKQKGLSITINTLTESALGKGYLGEVFRLEDWNNTLLIIDEIESFLTACLESGTINKSRQVALEQFKNIVQHVVRNGGQVLIMDAHLRYRSIKLLEQFIAEAKERIYNEDKKHSDYRAFTICNNYKRLKGREINVYESAAPVISYGVNTAKEGGKVIQFTDVKSASSRNYFAANSLGKWLRTQPLESFIISADTKTLTDDSDFGFVDKIYEFVQKPSFYGVITPTISSGTDWNNFNLDVIVGVYAGVTGLDANLQQLDRIRDHSPRHLYFPSRTAGQYDRDFVENYHSEIFQLLSSYAANVGGEYINTMVRFHGMTTDAAYEHLSNKFPETDKRWIEYWQNLQLEQIFEAEEFRYNHIARLIDEGCNVNLVNCEVDKALIAELKEFGNEEKERDLRNVSESDIDLETDDNAETYTSEESYTIRLNSITRFAGISSSQWVFINEANDMKYKIVERFSGRQASKKREGLQLRFAINKYMEGQQGSKESAELSKDILLAVDLKTMGTSQNKCRKDIKRNITSKFNFLVNTVNIEQILKNVVMEGIRLKTAGKQIDENSIGSFHNRMPWVNHAHKILLEYKDFVKKNFGVRIDARPDRAAANVKKIIAYLGYDCESKKVRDEIAGKDNNINTAKGCNLFVIKSDEVSEQVLALYDENWKFGNIDTIANRFNPDANTSGFWFVLSGRQPKSPEERKRITSMCEKQFEREYRDWDSQWVPYYLREKYERRIEEDLIREGKLVPA